MQGKLRSWCIAISVAAASVAAAMASVVVADDLSTAGNMDLLRSSIQRLAERPADPAQAAAAARQRLISSIEQLEHFLAGGGSEIASCWSAWLGLAALKEQLAVQQPDRDALQTIEERLYQNQVGL